MRYNHCSLLLVTAGMGFLARVHCLMADESRSRDISRHGGRVFRRYALLERAL